MTVEEELKEFIKTEYQSMLAFSKAVDIPYPTLDSMFKRGLENSSSRNVFKLCKFLGISGDGLADDEIIPRDIPKFTVEEVRLMEKYRALDERGKRAVYGTLEREYGYTKNSVEDSSIKVGAD